MSFEHSGVANLAGTKQMWSYDALPKLEKLYQEAAMERRRLFSSLFQDSVVSERLRAAVDALRRDGYVKLPGFFDPGRMQALIAEVDDCFRTGRHLRATRRMDANYNFDGSMSAGRDDLGNGEGRLKESVNYLQVEEPLQNLEGIFEFAFNEDILAMMGLYLECPPLLTYIKVQRSYVNSLPAKNTQLYHVDLAGQRLPKVFLYLSKVDEGGGPFTFVRKSHVDRFDGWLDQPRWDEAEMAARYGADAIVPLCGEPGDLVIAETLGFHCGRKPTAQERTVAILSYGAHHEYGNEDVVNIRHHDLQRLTSIQRSAADILRPVD